MCEAILGTLQSSDTVLFYRHASALRPAIVTLGMRSRSLMTSSLNSRSVQQASRPSTRDRRRFAAHTPMPVTSLSSRASSILSCTSLRSERPRPVFRRRGRSRKKRMRRRNVPCRHATTVWTLHSVLHVLLKSFSLCPEARNGAAQVHDGTR